MAPPFKGATAKSSRGASGSSKPSLSRSSLSISKTSTKLFTPGDLPAELLRLNRQATTHDVSSSDIDLDSMVGDRPPRDGGSDFEHEADIESTRDSSSDTVNGSDVDMDVDSHLLVLKSRASASASRRSSQSTAPSKRPVSRTHEVAPDPASEDFFSASPPAKHANVDTHTSTSTFGGGFSSKNKNVVGFAELLKPALLSLPLPRVHPVLGTSQATSGPPTRSQGKPTSPLSSSARSPFPPLFKSSLIGCSPLRSWRRGSYSPGGTSEVVV